MHMQWKSQKNKWTNEVSRVKIKDDIPSINKSVLSVI